MRYRLTVALLLFAVVRVRLIQSKYIALLLLYHVTSYMGRKRRVRSGFLRVFFFFLVPWGWGRPDFFPCVFLCRNFLIHRDATAVGGGGCRIFCSTTLPTRIEDGSCYIFALLRSLPSAIDALDTLYEPNAVFSQFLGSVSMTFFLFSFPCFLLSCLLFSFFFFFDFFSFLPFPFSSHLFFVSVLQLTCVRRADA